MSKGLAELALAVEKEPIKQQNEKIEKSISKDDKFAILRQLEKTLNKQFNTTASILRIGDKVNIKIPSIASNLPSIDYDVIGSGGIPRGRIIEIFGPESAGKTTLAMHFVAQEQKNTDNICAYIDAEHSVDPTYSAKLGVNMNDLIFSQPSSGEEALETVEALVDSNTVSLIVIDSVAALVPQAELDGEMGDSNMGLQARLMSQAMRKLRGKANTNNVTLVFLNQIREKIGVMFGSPETTTGGRALKFFASVRLDVRRKELIGEKEHPLGHRLKVKAVKNKVGTPLRETEVNLIYGKGLDISADLIESAVKEGIIEKSGAWYSFEGERLGHGIENAGKILTDSPEILEKIRLTIQAKHDKV